jgi:hypothetical protein
MQSKGRTLKLKIRGPLSPQYQREKPLGRRAKVVRSDISRALADLVICEAFEGLINVLAAPRPSELLATITCNS